MKYFHDKLCVDCNRQKYKFKILSYVLEQGSAKSYRGYLTMDEGNNLDPEDQLTNKWGTPSDRESKDIIIDATILSLRRKNPNGNINQFLSDARAVISSLSQEERDSDDLHVIIVNKLGGETQYSDEDEVFYLAVKELLENSEVVGLVREYMKVNNTVECEEAAHTIFDFMAGTTVAELKSEHFPHTIGGMIHDFFLGEAKSPSESDSHPIATGYESRKRKASMEDVEEHTSNAKRLLELPSTKQGEELILEKIFEYMFKENRAEIDGKLSILIPAILTLQRKFINDDYTQFEERIMLIISALTEEDLRRDDLQAVIIRKSGDGVEYTAEDEEHFKAFKELTTGNADIMVELMQEIQKEVLKKFHPTDGGSEQIIDVAGHHAKIRFLAGLTIEEISLEEKVDDEETDRSE